VGRYHGRLMTSESLGVVARAGGFVGLLTANTLVAEIAAEVAQRRRIGSWSYGIVARCASNQPPPSMTSTRLALGEHFIHLGFIGQ
jgi:hypothetical protein